MMSQFAKWNDNRVACKKDPSRAKSSGAIILTIRSDSRFSTFDPIKLHARVCC